MSEAPERIWLNECDWTQATDAFTLTGIEYVRADIYRSMALDALAAETQAADAYAAQLKAEAIAAKLAWVLRRVINDEHWRTTDNTLWPNATAALAEYEAIK